MVCPLADENRQRVRKLEVAIVTVFFCCSCLISLYVILGVLWFKMSMDTASLLAVDVIVCFAALGTGKLGLLGRNKIQLNMGRRIGQSLLVRLLTFCYLLLMQSAMRSHFVRSDFKEHEHLLFIRFGEFSSHCSLMNTQTVKDKL